MERTAELLIELHRLVDEAAAPLAERHSARLRCARACADCCVDEISVFAVEADRIREHGSDLLATAAPHPVGACAMLDEHGACRVYDHRPYVCRTQGLPLRWFEEIEPDEWAELRDICPLNEEGEPEIVALEEEACWTIGPFEERLAMLQHTHGGGPGARVSLRSLFERGG
jgi:uncharacterized protein